MPRFQRSRLNGVAVIAKTHKHTHTHTHTYTHTYCRIQVIPKKKKIFAVIDIYLIGKMININTNHISSSSSCLLEPKGLQATDQIPPSVSVGCNSVEFSPGEVLSLNFSLQFSPPGVRRSSPTSIALRVPMKSPSSDIVLRSSKGVSQPSPLSFPDYICHRFLSSTFKEFLITYYLRVPNPKNVSQTFVYEGLESILIHFGQVPSF